MRPSIAPRKRSDTWATLTPSSAGSISLATLRVVGSAQAARMATQRTPIRGSRPRRSSAGTCRASCSRPPTITPTAWAKMGSMPWRANQGAPQVMDRISDTFSSTGEAAGTANFFQVLRMPPASATSDMKPM